VAALVAQPLFVAAWITAGALQPGYSHARQGISELGARGAAHPLIINSAIVVLGLSFVALGVALYGALPRRRARIVAALLFAGAGITIALAGPLNLDCAFSERSCRDLWRDGALTWRTDAHLWLDPGAQLLLVLTPFALARALRPSPGAAAAAAAGFTGLAIGAVLFALGIGGVAGGVMQRLGFLMLHSWVFIVGAGILYATRAPARRGELIPLRPRDFMAGEWIGQGELVIRPLFLGRLCAQRFEARRRTTSISDTIWRIDDEARFGDRVERRRLFAEWVSNDHIRLTANDLPDGAEMWLEDGGYRTAPFRMAFALGPLPLLVLVRDTSYVESDGTFVNRFDAETVIGRLPLSRTVFRVRPVRAEYSRASASDAPPASSEASPAPG
jgi:hypothetical protein